MKKHWCYYSLMFGFILIMAGCLFGCKAGEKAVAKYKASSEFPKDCSDSFPITADTFLVEGKTIIDSAVHYEYVNVEVPGKDYVIEKLTTKTVTVTKYRTDTIRVVKKDSAQIKHLNLVLLEQAENHIQRVAALEADNEKKAKKLDTRTGQRNWLAGILSIIAVYHFRSQIASFIGGPVGKLLALIAGLFKRKK